MIYLLYTIHIVISLFLIAIVLLQQGKGADLSVFGGGATQTAFGARGATTLIHKLTVGAFVGFILTTLMIGIVQSRENAATPLSSLPEAAAALPSEEAAPAPATDAPAAAPATEGAVAPAGDAPAGDAPAGDAAPAPAGDAAPAPGDAPAAPAEEPVTPPPGN